MYGRARIRDARKVRVILYCTYARKMRAFLARNARICVTYVALVRYGDVYKYAVHAHTLLRREILLDLRGEVYTGCHDSNEQTCI